MSADIPVRAKVDDRDIDSLIAALRKTGKEAGMAEKDIAKLEKQVRSTGTSGAKNVNALNQSLVNTNSTLDKLAKTAVGFFAVQQVKQFITEITKVTAEFQKLRALLNNTLGSEGAGTKAFATILEFASKTPFQVSQITAAFIKLANRGFVPTREELVKIGDLTSAMGKNFDQLVEAILDAQTGEFERLKEFGIRASKQGEQVEFAFKGVKTQVEFTEKAIRDYILSLGELEGISGSMAVVSETLGGKLSNAADSAERLMAAFGESNGGVLDFFITKFGQLTQVLAEFIEVANADPFRNYVNEEVQKEIERFNKLTRDEQAEAINTVVQEVQKYRRELKQLEQLYKDASVAKNTEEFAAAAEKAGVSVETAQLILKDYQLELNLTNSNLAIAEQSFKQFLKVFNTDQAAVELPLLKKLDKELKKLKASRDAALDEETLAKYNRQIQLLEAEINRLKELGKVVKDTNIPETLDKITKAYDPLFDAINKAFGKDFLPDQKEIVDEQLKEFDKLTERQLRNYKKLEKANKERLKKMKEDEQRYQDFLRDVRQAGFDFANDLLDSFNQAQLSSIDSRISQLNEQRAKELENLESRYQTSEEFLTAEELLERRKQEEKRELNKRFDEEERRLRIQRANRERNLALFGIAVDTAEAVVKAISQSPLTFGLPFSAFAIATGAAQAAVVSGANPGFKDGVFNLEGPGTTKSDSIPANLSRGESVVPAEVTEKFAWLLKPMIEDKGFDMHKLRPLVDLNIPSQFRGDLMLPPAVVATDMSETNALLRKLNNKPTHSINVDKNGFSLHIREQQQYTQFVNNRYRMDV
ncbi:MAG: hypothetical protein ACFB2Y_16970 [Fulvivirga sp.]